MENLKQLYIQLENIAHELEQPIFYKDWTFWSTLVLAITLAFLIWYAFSTKIIASQTKESNLRPVMLRSGYISKWDDVKFEINKNQEVSGNLLTFVVQKNIATDINGWIIKNNYKYPLYFGNEISKLEEGKFYFTPKWGWTKNDSTIFAFFRESDKQDSKKSNQIILQYHDIEGNPYHTIENENFIQKSQKGLIKNLT